jgi:hypothetical protein
VTTRELQASSGRVRCGHCQEVFDAFASLTAQEPTAEAPPPPTVRPMNGDGAAARPVSPPADAATPPRADRERAPAPVRSAERSDPAASLYEWEFRMPPQRRRAAFWAVLALALLAALAVQSAIAFRDDLLGVAPGLQAGYERVCSWLGCVVGLPRLADRLHVESSDLRVLHSARPGEIELTVLLRSRAPLAIEYPAFELALSDSANQVLARRVFLPAEYLPPGTALESGFPANSEVPIKLYLDTGSIAATGYRLYFFYP